MGDHYFRQVKVRFSDDYFKRNHESISLNNPAKIFDFASDLYDGRNNIYAFMSYDAKLQARFALGNLGRAKRIASAGDFDDKLRESLRFLRISKDMDTISRMEFDKKIAADKQGICDYLDIFTLWFRDVLYFKASNDLDGIIFQNEQKGIKERAAVSSYEGIMKILEAIDIAKARLKANVNPELVLELLFLTIWEE